jgi:hypothetical protein
MVKKALSELNGPWFALSLFTTGKVPLALANEVLI